MIDEYNFRNLCKLKKDKAAFRTLKSWLYGGKEISEVELAKVLSSCLTHSLIEISGELDTDKAIDKALGYKCDLLATMVRNLVLGLTSMEITRRILLNLLEGDVNENS